jgi:hypothetical protein
MRLIGMRPAGWRSRLSWLIALAIVLGAVLVAKLVPTMIGHPADLPGAAVSAQTPFHSHSGAAALGVSYHLKIYTQCGLASWGSPDFAGSFWDSVGPNDDGNGNPPPGVGNPFDQGTMVLLSQNTARFTSQTGATFLFTRHAGDKVFPACW